MYHDKGLHTYKDGGGVGQRIGYGSVADMHPISEGGTDY